MTKKRKTTKKSRSAKKVKYDSKSKAKIQNMPGELSDFEKSMNRALSENWRLLANYKIVYKLANPSPGRSLLNGQEGKKEPIYFLRSIMTDELINHIKNIINKNLSRKVFDGLNFESYFV